MHSFRIISLPGDGIGPDVTAEAVKCLRAVESRFSGTRLDIEECPAGAAEYLRHGDPLPQKTIDACDQADAILLGAMGLPSVRWPSGNEMTPQIDIREIFDLYAGVRPIYLYHPNHTPLLGFTKPGEIDFVIFRENTEGMFASRKNAANFEADEVCDTLRITRKGAERISRAAFELAVKRRKRVALIDKANVLPTMAYFRSIFDGVARDFPDCHTERLYVDATALYLVQQPKRFDVLVMENLFGDILSDLAAGLIGGMGMAPSADIGPDHAVFQPSHGSAPDIAGQGIANPLATILSVALMLEWLDSEETRKGARWIEDAVKQVCSDPANATRDIGGSMSTTGMGDAVARAIAELP